MNTIFELLAAAIFSAAVAFTATAGSPKAAPPAVQAAAPVAAPVQQSVPDIWEIIRQDNQSAADVCAARSKK